MPRGTSTEVSTGMAFATSPVEQTNQVEMIQFDVYGTQGDEEDPRQQADGIPLGDRYRSLGEAD